MAAKLWNLMKGAAWGDKIAVDFLASDLRAAEKAERERCVAAVIEWWGDEPLRESYRLRDELIDCIRRGPE